MADGSERYGVMTQDGGKVPTHYRWYFHPKNFAARGPAVAMSFNKDE